MREVFRRELWRILLCLCILTAAAALLWSRMAEAAFPFWIPAALALWCLLLGFSRRVGAWGPAVLCCLALGLSLLPAARTIRDAFPDLAALAEQPSCLPPLLALCSLLLWYAPDRFALRAGAALVWLGLWISAALLGWELPRLTVISLMPLPLLAVCEAFFRLRRRGEAAYFAPLRGWLCLVLILASLLTLLAPTPAEPYGYPMIRAMIDKVEGLWHDYESRTGHRREGDRQFGLRFDGVAEQPDTGLTGESSSEGGPSLYVQPFAATIGPLYLSANAWDRFDGRGWTQTVPEEDESDLLWNMDTMEHVYALWRWQQAHGGTDNDRYFRSNHIYIYYGSMDTRTMFGTMNALDFYYDEARYPSTAGAGGILFDYMQENGTAYRMYWLEANARTLKQLIAYSEGYVYDPEVRRGWYSLKERFEPRFHLDIRENVPIEELLSRRQERIRARCLDTEGVSPRAAALAAEITADCGTDYEKLMAIAAYLQTNYHYTVSPAPAPEGENFLDWLLFETGEGYCTWYATAAALLARSMGIPTRYVQGYRAEALAARRFTAIDPDAAHAWCEGYVAGYGWVTVEATPGFAAAGRGWNPVERAVLEDEARGSAQGKGQSGLLPDKKTETAPKDRPGPETKLWYLALLPPGLALILAAYWLARQWRLRRRYLNMPPEEQVRQDLRRLLDYLSRRGCTRAPEESVYSCFAAHSWLFLPIRREQVLAMAEFYESVLFGGHVPDQEEMAAERRFVESLRPRRKRFFR